MIPSSEARIKEYVEKGWWGTATIEDYFLQLVEQCPDKTAVVDPINRPALCGGSTLRLTYKELEQRVNTVAEILLENGIGKDDIVAIQLPNIVELVITYLAVLRVGAISSPFPIQFREYECSRQLELLGAKAVITMDKINNREYASMHVKIKEQIPSVQHVFVYGDQVSSGTVPLRDESKSEFTRLKAYRETIAVTADDIFTICWTSGTEGKPKGVPRSHNEWFISAYATVDAAQLTGEDHILLTFPMVNMAGIGGMLIPWLLSGGKLVLHHPFDLPSFLQQVEHENITYTLIPPALLNMMLKNEAFLNGKNISSLRVVGTGSAPLTAWMISGWKEKHGVDIINYFGSNEGAAFLSSPTDIPEPDRRAKYFPRFGVKGISWDNRISERIESKLMDTETGEEITESHHPGELRIRGASVFSGYWKGEELNHVAFDQDGFFCTGDLFEITGDQNQYYRVVGRVKDVINRGGLKISPEELEGLLQGHPLVADVAVVSYPDPIMGENVCVCIVAKESADIKLEELVTFLREKQIASYKLPERLLVLKELPRNPVGKIMKNQLRELVKGELVPE
ncbi:class I adenylate-forming enzyme family protein [Neobacillus niacini]|uniref:class I adenylate-forming enzyme family protein n=1 Tax=Neobacillus niacini TaxID=86668 RepID=UPI0021CB17C9|nr:class I adenylate-forming enzyme family protein [Neobacillus niacini]MCM3763817.1 acyl--CoA ligase [Neobacillus niacini]